MFMSHSTLRAIAAAIVALAISAPAAATMISYDALNLDGNLWEYQYTVDNSTLDRPIEEFAIFFDLGPDFSVLHSNIELTAPAGWDPLLLVPDANLPDNGSVDWLALGSGVDPGQLLAGFAVRFLWLGDGIPPEQRFEILNPISFEVLDRGLTTARTSVPEPSMSLLLATALVVLLAFGRRARRTSPSQYRSALVSS